MSGKLSGLSTDAHMSAPRAHPSGRHPESMGVALPPQLAGTLDACWHATAPRRGYDSDHNVETPRDPRARRRPAAGQSADIADKLSPARTALAACELFMRPTTASSSRCGVMAIAVATAAIYAVVALTLFSFLASLLPSLVALHF